MMFLLVTSYTHAYPGNIKYKNDEKKNIGLKEQEDCTFEERSGVELKSPTINTLTSYHT